MVVRTLGAPLPGPAPGPTVAGLPDDVAAGLVVGLFFVAVGVVQWRWPTAIVSGMTSSDATPGIRVVSPVLLAIGAWLLHAAVLGAWFGGLFVPGSVLVLLGMLLLWHSPPPLAGREVGGRPVPRLLGGTTLVVGAALLGLSLHAI